MDRRELLKLVALASGTALIGGEFFLSGCANPEAGPSTEFTPETLAFLDEVGETILPKTTTPGAKDAKIAAFMTVYVNDCYTKADQKVFHEGIQKLDDACKEMHKESFMKAKPEQRKSLLVKLDGEAKKQAADNREKDQQDIKKERDEHEKGNTGFEREKRSAHYFSMMKQLTVLGFYTSKEGRMGALRYKPVPGSYDGNLDYKKGDKAFAGLN